MQEHPYVELEDKSFWKTAVGQPLADKQKFKGLIDYMIPNAQAKIASTGFGNSIAENLSTDILENKSELITFDSNQRSSLRSRLMT